MKVDQKDCASVVSVEGDRLSKEMWSDSTFFQRAQWMVLLDLQLMKIVLLVIVGRWGKGH